MLDNRLLSFPGITPQEKVALDEILKTLLTEQKREDFLMYYASNRKDPTIVLVCTCLGFFGAAGIQRLLLGQILMGIIYFFTGGLCLIGTIYDLLNYKSLTTEYNISKAREGYQMLK